MDKIAVVLFNLGGPDSLNAVRPFLFNLFNDPLIINRTSPIRQFIAYLIAKRRVSITSAIYGYTKGHSLLLKESEAQRYALEDKLQTSGLTNTRVFLAMRYWNPFIRSVAQDVQDWHPERVILLPLYPQFSITTTGSALMEWEHVAGDLKKQTDIIYFWNVQIDWILAIADLIRKKIKTAYESGHKNLRFIFSAHGLPESVLTSGDLYQHQVEETVVAILSVLKELEFDYRICYQSRVGSHRWIGPTTRDIIQEAGNDCMPIILVPISFTSEHIETIVELDIEYRHVAITSGVPAYFRVSTVRTHPYFIIGLTKLIISALTKRKK